jgi:hypothetical protein
MNERARLTRERLKSPRAAAVAGILFAILFTVSVVLIRLAIPEELSGSATGAWLLGNTSAISLALTLLPFGGIAFLWFIGVVRDQLGKMEDQLFATVFFGSGLLFLAMMFVAAAIAGGILNSVAIAPDVMNWNSVALFASVTANTVMRVYAIRMAGVFMIPMGTIWMRTGNMPRPFVFLTYGLALLMLLTVNATPWLMLILPAWVFVVSVYILIRNRRGESGETGETSAADEIIGASQE